MGVATTLDVPTNILRSAALQCLYPCKFTLQSPIERMDAVLEAVLVQLFSGFFISHKVANFMRDYFINQDGTLCSFVRALKVNLQLHPLLGLIGICICLRFVPNFSSGYYFRWHVCIILLQNLQVTCLRILQMNIFRLDIF